MAVNVNTSIILWAVIVLAFFIAGFAGADILLFGGETMPEFIKPFAGLIVCVAVGIFCSLLFIRQNPRPS